MPRRKGGIFIALYHCSIKIISRGKGKSAVAAAAYRSGEKLKSEYDGQSHDYTKKAGVAYTEIMLPANAPLEFADRSFLWNSVEKIEKSKNSQLAREIEIAIPNELTRQQQISLVREYVKDNFVDNGMCADIAIHDKEDGNPHAHIMLTVRPLNEDGTWGAKSKKEYILDKDGEKIKLKNGNYKTRKADTVDWNDKEKAELWRSKWADIANKYLAENEHAERIDHRSFERQGIEQIPSVHLGVAASQMERKGIATERGNINREIKAQNKILAEIKAKLSALKKWIADIFKKSKEAPEYSENLIELLLRIKNDNKTRWQKISALQDISKAVSYLQNHNITTREEFDEQFAKVKKNYSAIRSKTADVSERLKLIKELHKQGGIYLKTREIYEKYKSQKPRKQADFYEKYRSDIVLCECAIRYLKEHHTGTKLPMKKWYSEIEALTSEYNSLSYENKSISDEYKLLIAIKTNIENITKQRGRSRKKNIEYER